MQHDDIVNGWLSGADSVDGYENPAGSLYVEGIEVTEASIADRRFGQFTICSGCSASGGSICC